MKERISSAARGEAEGQRPMLLFPEGTTTNGLYLLPFKSGAFLAGCPLQPVILKYEQVDQPCITILRLAKGNGCRRDDPLNAFLE